ncbi:unnamed protein product [Protopolystoma xenopodis]|uniref:Uncharacterized protein n=1 Tax=Protopolystoma xenopodis TaxID=117903 RepID=A0A448XJI6_9PLAT|nr:unnamed protein product [Protopolystoma xenopodis]
MHCNWSPVYRKTLQIICELEVFFWCAASAGFCINSKGIGGEEGTLWLSRPRGPLTKRSTKCLKIRLIRYPLRQGYSGTAATEAALGRCSEDSQWM